MATGGVVTWSKTAATNATADPAVNFAEGQAPSSVNDSARALMASVAKWRDDVSGTLTTGGTSTAYTVTTNATFASLSAMNGQVITIIPHTTSGASPTLAVDGLTAKPIRTATAVNAVAGVLVAGTPYQLVYFSSVGEFILMNLANTNFPSTTAMLFVQTSAPAGWTKSTTHNDKALRIVSGTAGTGGSTAFTSIFTSRTIAQGNLPNVTLTGTPGTASQTLTHTQSGQTAIVPNSGASTTNVVIGAGATVYASGQFAGMADHTVSFPNYSVSLGGSATALDFAVQYVDCILALKD